MTAAVMVRVSSVSPERALIARAQSGDNEAFSQLVEAYRNRMLRTAAKVVRDPLDAEDVVQQAFTAAWLNLGKFRGDSAFSTWLTRITINEGLSVLRRRKRLHVEITEQIGDAAVTHDAIVLVDRETPEHHALQSELTRLVRQSMSEVKPAYRAAMRLRLLEDLSLEEISARLSIPVNTVKVHLFRGRQAMKAFLSPRLSPAAA